MDSDKQIVSTKQRVMQCKAFFETKAFQNAMTNVCSGLIKSDRAIQIYINLINSRTDLTPCSSVSLAGVLLQATQLGLSFDPALGHAYPVPYRNKTGTVAQLIVGYRGLQKLARNSGEIKYFDGQVVYEGDEFSYSFGTDAHIHHVPSDSRDAVGNETNIRGAWYMAKLTNGEIVFDYMPIRDILAIRERSIAYRAKSGPWLTDFAAMCLKTVARRLAKKLPLSVLAEKAVALDEMAEAGVEQPNAEEFGFVDVPSTPSVVVPEPEPEPEPSDLENSAWEQGAYEGEPVQEPEPPQRPVQRPPAQPRPPQQQQTAAAQKPPQTQTAPPAVDAKEKLMIELLKFMDENKITGDQWDSICEQSRIGHNNVASMDYAQLSAVVKNLKLVYGKA